MSYRTEIKITEARISEYAIERIIEQDGEVIYRSVVAERLIDQNDFISSFLNVIEHGIDNPFRKVPKSFIPIVSAYNNTVKKSAKAWSRES